MKEITNTSKISNTEYENLITKSLNLNENKEKTIVEGKIIAIENNVAIIDVGLKSEGRIPISEFSRSGQDLEIKIGDSFKVFIDRLDGLNGETTLSREKAVKQAAWNNLQDSYDNKKFVTGIPFNKVKGGMSVDLDGVIAFLPGSQVDNRQFSNDTKELLNKPMELMILKMDKYRGNIVVSRKVISDLALKEQRQKLLSSISEDSVLEGRIKNITEYGAFIDLGGIDGLVHVTDICWKKINHPSDVLVLGANLKVKVLKYDKELEIILAKSKKFNTKEGKELVSNMIKVADLTRKGFVNGDISTVMSPRTVLHWAENSEIFKDIGYSFKITFLNKCDDLEKNIIAEYYQRCFGEDLPESTINIKI